MNMLCNHNAELAKQMREDEDAERRNEEREAMIEARARDLMQEGGECYPYSMANMIEALGQATDKEFLLVLASLRAYKNNTSDDIKGYLAVNLADHLTWLIEDYWLGVAKHLAKGD